MFAGDPSTSVYSGPSFPERVGKYELLLPLGTGGTATVYLARSRGVAGFEREVALKLVHAHLRADEESRMHLLEEARLAARIRHPNVVPVTEVDSDACGVFLVMDYVEGESLSGLVKLLREKERRLAPRLAARIINDALAGLHAAHELHDSQGEPTGLVHRDFSPQNILVGIEGVARLADFGVAKAASRTVRTKTGLVKGKVAYMSPEQARGHKIDRRCDVWAAGVVVWELLTGRKLFDHEDDVATLLSVVTEEPPRLSEVLSGVPPALDDAVAYALTSDVEGRCPSAEALRSLLEAAWSDVQGMATPAELGDFVRQTVGEKLAERRALIAKTRPSSPTATAKPSQAQAVTVPASMPPSAPSPTEEGTRTAISAAVPSAYEPLLRPTWRRWGAPITLAAVVGMGSVAFALWSPLEAPTASPLAVEPAATSGTAAHSQANEAPSPPAAREESAPAHEAPAHQAAAHEAARPPSSLDAELAPSEPIAQPVSVPVQQGASPAQPASAPRRKAKRLPRSPKRRARKRVTRKKIRAKARRRGTRKSTKATSDVKPAAPTVPPSKEQESGPKNTKAQRDKLPKLKLAPNPFGK